MSNTPNFIFNPTKARPDKSGFGSLRSFRSCSEPDWTVTRTATLGCKQARRGNTQAKPENTSARSGSILEKTARPSVMSVNTSATLAKVAPGKLESIVETPD
jgi:hypothetical protein